VDDVTFERVTNVTPEIAQAIERLYPQLSDSDVPRAEELARATSGGGTSLFLARLEGSVVGMGTIVVYHVLTGTTAHIEDVVVDAAHRGRGVGERLMRHLIADARAQGAESIALTSHPSREAANRLYQRLGFEQGTTNHYLLDLGSRVTESLEGS
jgi:ribosomal protein S18 acetylase RimI-like enzyme